MIWQTNSRNHLLCAVLSLFLMGTSSQSASAQPTFGEQQAYINLKGTGADWIMAPEGPKLHLTSGMVFGKGEVAALVFETQDKKPASVQTIEYLVDFVDQIHVNVKPDLAVEYYDTSNNFVRATLRWDEVQKSSGSGFVRFNLSNLPRYNKLVRFAIGGRELEYWPFNAILDIEVSRVNTNLGPPATRLNTVKTNSDPLVDRLRGSRGK